MINAFCTHPDSLGIFNIDDFKLCTETEIEKLRQHLECPECKGKSFYRKESVDGKAACFGSRYHSEFCMEGRSSAQIDLEKLHTKEIKKIISSFKEITFDFSFNSKAQSSISQTKKKYSDNKNGLNKSVEMHERQVSLSMKMALNSLMRGNDLSQSEILIEIDQGYKFKAKNLFVNFSCAEAAETSRLARPKMYWGTISHSDQNLDWFNPSDCVDVGIPIQKHKKLILNRFNINDKRDVEGAGLILFGRCFWNQQKNRKIIEVWNEERIYISKFEE